MQCWNLYQGAVLEANSTSLAVWSLKESISQSQKQILLCAAIRHIGKIQHPYLVVHCIVTVKAYDMICIQSRCLSPFYQVLLPTSDGIRGHKMSGSWDPLNYQIVTPHMTYHIFLKLSSFGK